MISPALAPLVRPIEGLHEDPHNARLHNEESTAAVARSLERFGQQKPIVVAHDGTVIAGNGTLRAAISLGWTEIAAQMTDLDGNPARAYALADNRTAELSTWDLERLAEQTRALDADAEPVADLGFSEKELDALVREANRKTKASGYGVGMPVTVAVRPDEVHSKLGEVYQLGPHLLLCGDSTDAHQVARLFEDGATAQLFATDPPYLIGYSGGVDTNGKAPSGRKDWSALSIDKRELDPKRDANKKGKRGGNRRGKNWDELYHEQAKDGDAQGFHERYIRACQEHLAKNCAWYCWHADARHEYLAAAWESVGAYWHQTIIWVKPTFVMGGCVYHYQHEPCSMGWVRPGKPPMLGEGNESTVWSLGWGQNGEVAKNVDCPDHPTAKPLGVWRIPMLKHTRPGDVCYEPFAGSGGQIIAADQLGRVCRAVELEPVFVDVIRRRWTAYANEAGKDPGPGALDPAPAVIEETSDA